MATILIRDIDDQTLDRLKSRAARNGRSLQSELQRIVERAASTDIVDSRELAARIRRKLAGRKHTSTAMIAADRRR